jgi:hypothetical protein
MDWHDSAFYCAFFGLTVLLNVPISLITTVNVWRAASGTTIAIGIGKVKYGGRA